MALPLLNYFAHGDWVDPPVGSEAWDVVAADSFVLFEGEIVGYTRHLERFFDAVADAGFSIDDDVTEFIERSELWFPREGRWFPRFDLISDGNDYALRYHHRVAPPAESEATLIVAPEDPRRVPHRKGPDLEAMGSLRRWATTQGATEALITDVNGVVIEGAYSSIVVIDPETNELSVTPPEWSRISSITEQLVCELAEDEGMVVTERPHTLAQWEHKEVWVLSALHGIRQATAVIDGPPLAHNSPRAEHFTERLREYDHPLDGVF